MADAPALVAFLLLYRRTDPAVIFAAGPEHGSCHVGYAKWLIGPDDPVGAGFVVR